MRCSNGDCIFQFDESCHNKEVVIGDNGMCRSIELDPKAGYKYFEEKCPRCGHNDLVYGRLSAVRENVGEDYAKQKCTCSKCKHSFIIWSSLHWAVEVA